jgi:hypothetical protein
LVPHALRFHPGLKFSPRHFRALRFSRATSQRRIIGNATCCRRMCRAGRTRFHHPEPPACLCVTASSAMHRASSACTTTTGAAHTTKGANSFPFSPFFSLEPRGIHRNSHDLCRRDVRRGDVRFVPVRVAGKFAQRFHSRGSAVYQEKPICFRTTRGSATHPATAQCPETRIGYPSPSMDDCVVALGHFSAFG